MIHETPLVSIIIPVYNGSDYVAEAIDSALAQTYQNIEVIVVNDGSNDAGATEDIILSYGDKVRYFKKENGGVSSALNIGIQNMKGEYFSWLSHDDVYAASKVANQVNALLEYHDKNLICLCGTRQIDSHSDFIGTTEKHRFQKNGVVSWQDALYNLLTMGTFHGCAFLIPKKVFEVCGFFDESLRYSQDTLMWMNIFTQNYNLVYIDSLDVYGRVHEKQLTQTGRGLYKENTAAIAKKMTPVFDSISTPQFDFIYAYAKHIAFRGFGDILRYVIKNSSLGGHFNFKQLQLRVMLIYGHIRPLIRRVYYTLFRKMKTL